MSVAKKWNTEFETREAEMSRYVAPHARQYLTAALVAVIYPLLSYFLIGFKPEQLILVLIFVTFYLATPLTRKFIIGFSVFLVFWIIFDYMKAFPNYHYQDVHIRSLHDAELSVFSIAHNNSLLTPNEYWAQNTSSLLDVLSGLFYLCWVPVPLAFAGYLFYKDRSLFLRFALTFLLVNLIGFIFYYLYPAAPPWYVQQYGFDFIAGTPGNTAGLSRFDQFFGIQLFHSIYAKSSNVFAAMPSLHSSYPLIVFYYGWKAKLKAVNILFGIVAIGIWFAAIYTSHHYVLDVLAGITCAISGITLFNWLSKNNSAFRKFLNQYEQAIS